MVTLWVPAESGRLHLLLLTPSDAHNPTAAVQEYIKNRFQMASDEYTLASLLPGVSYPIPTMRFTTDLHKGVILCLPTTKLELNIHIQHLVKGSTTDKVKFKSMKVSASALQSIKDLKNYIQKTRGIPTSIQELVYNGHAMRNSKLILDYNLTGGTKLHLLLQPMKSFSILCKTFWGKSYHLEVNPCTTVEELIDKVLLLSLSDSHTDADVESIFGPRAMYKHLILAEYQEVVLDKQSCLNHFSITAESCVNISASSEMRRDTHRFIQVAMGATLHEVRCGAYDTWLMAALRLHGQTGLSLDLMQLCVNDKPVDFKNTIGSFRLEGTAIKLGSKVESTPLQLTVNVRLPSGHTESVSCHPKALVKDVKTSLEARGVHDVQLYDLQYKRVLLPPHSRLSDFRLPDRGTLELTLGEFPVCATHGGNSARVMVHKDQTLGSVLRKLEDRIGTSALKHCVLHAGEDLYNYDTVRVSESFLHLHSHLYVEHLPPATPVLHLVAGDDVIPLAVRSTMDSLAMQQLSALAIDTTTMMESLKWFIKWRFPDKSISHSQTRQQSMSSSVSRRQSFHGGSGRANQPSSSSNDKTIMTSLHRSHSLHQARTTPSVRTNKFTAKPTESTTSSKSFAVTGTKKTVSRSSSSCTKSSKPLPHLTHTMEPHAPSTTAMPRKPAIKSCAPPQVHGYQVKPRVPGQDQGSNSGKKKLSVRFEIPTVENESKNGSLKSTDRSKSSDSRFIRGTVSYPMNGLRNSQSSMLHRNKYTHNLMQSVE